MISKQLQDVIQLEAKKFHKEHHKGSSVYVGAYTAQIRQEHFIAGATKYAGLMIEFADWISDNRYKKVRNRLKDGKWYIQSAGYGGGEPIMHTTSDLLTIFITTLKP